MVEVATIVELVDKDSNVYKLLESLCICFPGRLSGSATLEAALDFLLDYGKENLPVECCIEEVVESIPCWTRGLTEEFCFVDIIPNIMSKPKPNPLKRKIRVLANGMSVGTHESGLEALIEVVESWDQLRESGEMGNLRGKIVLYDYRHFIQYGNQSAFRNSGANEASKYGALGVLIRSLAPDATTSGPHTGSQREFEETVTPIPAACISVEDAELLRRLHERGHQLKATLFLPCVRLPDQSSRNLVFEITGSDLSDEVVLVGGHTDSWDCQYAGCQGAHDDGQGVVVALEIVRLLCKAGLKPRRTIRAVLFVDEECRQSGARAYAERHAHEAATIVAAIETDMGAGPPVGFGFSGSDAGREDLRRIIAPLGVLGNVTNVDVRWSGKGVDITPLIDDHAVPGLLLRHADSWWETDYFHFHHSTADTIDHVDPRLLELNLKVVLGTVWLLANSDGKISRSRKEPATKFALIYRILRYADDEACRTSHKASVSPIL